MWSEIGQFHTRDEFGIDGESAVEDIVGLITWEPMCLAEDQRTDDQELFRKA